MIMLRGTIHRQALEFLVGYIVKRCSELFPDGFAACCRLHGSFVCLTAVCFPIDRGRAHVFL
jgi:hypothetical protein